MIDQFFSVSYLVRLKKRGKNWPLVLRYIIFCQHRTQRAEKKKKQQRYEWKMYNQINDNGYSTFQHKVLFQSAPATY